ncbi:MAG TPA: DMT family transporter [Terriglobales bacterium]|nr:DMT family transporter [Terriglobales bacterium]
MSRSLKAHILLILVTLVWGATFVEIKDALRDISPLLFNAVRMALAAAVLAVIYLPHLKTIDKKVLRSGALVGVFLFLGYEFQTAGLRLTTPSKSAFLTSLSVVLVPVFLKIFWGRKTSAWTVIGVISAFIGLYLLTVPAGTGQSGLGDLRSVNLGDLLTVGCAVGFAFQIILVGRATSANSFEAIAFLQAAVAAALMFVSAPLVENIHVLWSGRVIAAILVTGLLGTAAAFTIQAWAQQFMAPTNTALIFALEPVFAWITSYLVLGERLGWRAVAGAGLILAGLVFSEMLGGAQQPISIAPESEVM